MMMLNIYDGRWVIGDCKLVSGYDVCMGFFIFLVVIKDGGVVYKFINFWC